MAYKTSSVFLARVFLISILLAIAGQAIAKRDIPSNPTNDDQMKQPEFLFKHDRSVLIPGLGRILLPPPHLKPHLKPHHPHSGIIGGGIGGSADGSTGGSSGGSHHIPGGDDTFVPNPGFEVPVPDSGAAGAGKIPHP